MGARRAVLQTPPESSHPRPLLSSQQPAPVTALNATLMHSLASVANKRLAPNLNPLDATLTKNRGGGATLPFLESSLNSFRSHRTFPIKSHFTNRLFSALCVLFQVPYPANPLLATLTKTAGCIPTIPIVELFRPFDSWTPPPYIPPFPWLACPRNVCEDYGIRSNLWSATFTRGSARRAQGRSRRSRRCDRA